MALTATKSHAGRFVWPQTSAMEFAVDAAVHVSFQAAADQCVRWALASCILTWWLLDCGYGELPHSDDIWI